MATRGARPPRAGARTDATSAPAASTAAAPSSASGGRQRQHQQQPGTVRAEQHVRRCGQTHGASSDGDGGLHGRELGVPDARDLLDVLDGLEAAVGRAVVDDLLRGGRPDPVECVELLERGRVDVDERAGARGAAGAAPRAPDDEAGAGAAATAGAPRSGTTICWPSVTGAARLTAASSALAVGPPASSRASVTRRSGRQAHDPGRADGAADVHHDVRSRRRAPRRSPRRPATPERTPEPARRPAPRTGRPAAAAPRSARRPRRPRRRRRRRR